jgi:pimeloyl-ACP methyl ester carboxylesterase
MVMPSRTAALLPLLASLACDARSPGAVRSGPTLDPPTVPGRSASAAAAAAPVSAPAPASAAPSAAPAPPPGPATVERYEVPGHLPASIVRSADGKPPRIVFLAGLCANAGAYLHGFPEAARAHGGAIAVDGDRPCGGSTDFRSITSDPAREEPRIDAALVAAGVTDPATADLVYVGYSLGATLLENLVKRSPQRYPRVVLIGSPRDPRLDRLRGARAVATVSCSLDVPGRMKGAVRTLEPAGVAVKYFEMPGCTHGNLAEGDRVLGEALGWIRAAGR